MSKPKKSKEKKPVLTFYEQKSFLIDIKNCPRCGKNHEELILYNINGTPIFKEDLCYDCWAICPKTESPILIGREKSQED